MDAHVYQYNIGKALDLSKLASIQDLQKIEGTKLLCARYGEVQTLVFPSGEIRAFVKGRDATGLKDALLAAGVKIMGLLQAIKSSGVDFDENEVFSKGYAMQFDYLLRTGSRATLGEDDHVNLIREMAFGPYDLGQSFQLERNFVQGGENLGHRLVTEDLKKIEEVIQKVTEYLKGTGLGVLTYTTEKGESGYDVYHFKLLESMFASGVPQIGSALCHFIRGIIRGAFIEFLELENISVKEESCWGLGDTFCSFTVNIYSN